MTNNRNPAASQPKERHATLRYERGTPGNENDMPSVVSCNWLPDGDYAVYLAAPQPPVASQPSPWDIEAVRVQLSPSQSATDAFDRILSDSQPPVASAKADRDAYLHPSPNLRAALEWLVTPETPEQANYRAMLSDSQPPAASQPSDTVKRWCETCEGDGYVFQKPQFGCHVWGNRPCPDCDGKGYWFASQPPAASQPSNRQIADLAAMYGICPPMVSYDKIIQLVRAMLKHAAVQGKK